LATLLLAAGGLSCGNEEPRPRVTINGNTFYVEIADTDSARGRGLGGRVSLDADKGMLFVFDAPKEQDFHMLDCYFPIDIAFIDEAGRIINLKTMAVEDDPTQPRRGYASDRPAKYVLETVGGTWERIGAAAGMAVEFVDVAGAP